MKTTKTSFTPTVSNDPDANQQSRGAMAKPPASAMTSNSNWQGMAAHGMKAGPMGAMPATCSPAMQNSRGK